MIRAVKTINEGATLISVKAAKHIVGMEPYAFVQISDFIWPEHLSPIQEASFGLTKAESSIIQLMTEGAPLLGLHRRGRVHWQLCAHRIFMWEQYG